MRDLWNESNTWLAAGCAVLWLSACDADSPAPSRVVPPPEAVSAPLAASGIQPLTVQQDGEATFLIDAPLEKIRGRSGKFRGNLQVDPSNILTARGQISVDLDDLKTATFNDPGKDARQTEHAHNWLQLGADVPEKERVENRWVRFTIQSISSASVPRLADVPEKDGKRLVAVVAEGELWLHGISVPKTAKLTVEFQGPPTAPTGVRVRSAEPLIVSLKAHDIKPRDVAGRFLDGALEKIGQKIEDTVQVTIDLTAVPGRI